MRQFSRAGPPTTGRERKGHRAARRMWVAAGPAVAVSGAGQPLAGSRDARASGVSLAARSRCGKRPTSMRATSLAVR